MIAPTIRPTMMIWSRPPAGPRIPTREHRVVAQESGIEISLGSDELVADDIRWFNRVLDEAEAAHDAYQRGSIIAEPLYVDPIARDQ